jgi:hypothetical protein
MTICITQHNNSSFKSSSGDRRNASDSNASLSLAGRTFDVRTELKNI